MRWLPAVIALSTTSLAQAGEISEAVAEVENGRYLIRLDMVVAGSRAAIWSIVNDYPNLNRIHNDIRSSRILARESEHVYRVRVDATFCVLLICVDTTKIQRVQRYPRRFEVISIILPEGGDFTFGREFWRMTELGPGRTRLQYQAELEPTMWTPPLVDAFFVRHRLLEDTLEGMRQIERMAAERDAGY